MATANELYAEAEQLKEEGKLEDCVAKLTEVLEADESHVLSHLTLAVVYGRMNRHEEAVKHGQRACELDGTDPFNFTAMSVTFQRAFQGTQNSQFIQMAEDAMARAQMLQAQR